MQELYKKSNYRAGFTLIELLVTLGIMGIMFGLGSMYFSQIVNNQQGKKSVSQVYQGLYKARQYAILGRKDKCDSADTLKGIIFHVTVTPNPSHQFKIQADCGGSNPEDIETVTLENTVSFVSNVNIEFNTPSGEVSTEKTFDLDIAGTTKNFTVNTLGTIKVE